MWAVLPQAVPDSGQQVRLASFLGLFFEVFGCTYVPTHTLSACLMLRSKDYGVIPNWLHPLAVEKLPPSTCGAIDGQRSLFAPGRCGRR